MPVRCAGSARMEGSGLAGRVAKQARLNDRTKGEKMIAFVFSGQGAQYSGMGKELYEASAAARKVFDLADTIRPGTSKQCFEGSDEELSITANTQPTLFCVDLAAARALEESGVKPDMAAGFSLGEVAALTYAGVFDDAAGFSFVCARASAMQRAAEENPGAMAAVLKLGNAQVEDLCDGFAHVWPVNYNCPGQLVVAGKKEEMGDFCTAVASAGGKAVPLKVSGGFHSPFMDSASEKLAQLLQEIKLSEPQIPVYGNLDAKRYGEVPERHVIKQVNHPVRWQETIENMAKAGADTFIEVGAGKTLCGLIKKTVKGVRVLNVQDAESFKKTISEVL